MYYVLGEPLYLSKDVETLAEIMQEQHSDTSTLSGMIHDYLETLVPTNWGQMSVQQRKIFLNGNITSDENLAYGQGMPNANMG